MYAARSVTALPIADGPRIRIRAMDVDADVDELWAITHTPLVDPETEAAQWCGLTSGPFASAREFRKALFARPDDASTFKVVVQDIASGDLLGLSTFMAIHAEHARLEIGWHVIAPKAQRTHVNTEAVWVMCRHAFALGYRRVEWKHNASNARSGAAARRFGFTFEGVFRNHMLVPCRSAGDGSLENRHTSYLSLLDTEWPTVRERHRATFPGALRAQDDDARDGMRDAARASPPRDRSDLMMVIASARDPNPRKRLHENKPETRRALILAALASAAGAAVGVAASPASQLSPSPVVLRVDTTSTGEAALANCVALGVLSAAKLDFLRTAHSQWRAAPSPEDDFHSDETAERDGLIPNFFVRAPQRRGAPWARRLAWHATDVYTPIYADLIDTLADDAAVCAAAVAHLVGAVSSTGKGPRTVHRDVYALTTHPGHHASTECYGGYCFVNNAVHCFKLAERAGRRPFLIDVDYHAGDGSASFLDATSFVSLHAPDDYPYADGSAPWGVRVEPGATWEATYAPALRAALARRPHDCDLLVVSLGFDTLDGDPCAADGHRMAIQCEDFSKMRALLRSAQVPMLVVQEGGYHLEKITTAALAFCRGSA